MKVTEFTSNPWIPEHVEFRGRIINKSEALGCFTIWSMPGEKDGVLLHMIAFRNSEKVGTLDDCKSWVQMQDKKAALRAVA